MRQGWAEGEFRIYLVCMMTSRIVLIIPVFQLHPMQRCDFVDYPSTIVPRIIARRNVQTRTSCFLYRPSRATVIPFCGNRDPWLEVILEKSTSPCCSSQEILAHKYSQMRHISVIYPAIPCCYLAEGVLGGLLGCR